MAILAAISGMTESSDRSIVRWVNTVHYENKRFHGGTKTGRSLRGGVPAMRAGR
jgi:hypothetical protein